MTSTRMLALVVAGLVGFSPGLASANVMFQHGVDGYFGTQDTELKERKADKDYGDKPIFDVDIDSDKEQHGLLRFDNIFGLGLWQVPPGEIIHKATLRLFLDSGGNDVLMWKMNTDWNQNTAKWNNSFGGDGIDGGDATYLQTLEGRPTSGSLLDDSGEKIDIDVTMELQDWLDGESNYGWGFTPTGTDSVEFATSENTIISYRPKLIVRWIPEPGTLAIFGVGLVGLGLYRRRRAA